MTTIFLEYVLKIQQTINPDEDVDCDGTDDTKKISFVLQFMFDFMIIA